MFARKRQPRVMIKRVDKVKPQLAVNETDLASQTNRSL